MAGKLLNPADAWGLLAETIQPLDRVRSTFAEALGGWLAEPICADRDIPAADRSAMDGFAVRSSDVSKSQTALKVVGEVSAGSPLDPPIASGECVRIYTGANIPTQADTVVPVENSSSGSFRQNPDDSDIQVLEAFSHGKNVFKGGEVAKSGSELLAFGSRLGPRQIAIAAATGSADVMVFRRPRAVILNTGEELLEPGAPAASHQIRNSNGPFLEAALFSAGFRDVSRRTVPDSKQQTIEALQDALTGADAVIVTGGISAGRRDYVPAALAAVGARIVFRGIAIKPGKPQVFARAPSGGLVFGLPGNPLSSLVGFYEFVLPALRRLAGCPSGSCRPGWLLPLAEAVRHEGDRHLVLPVDLLSMGSGLAAVPRRPVGSADLLTGGLVDGAVLIPPTAGSLAAGTLVTYRPWSQGWSS